MFWENFLSFFLAVPWYELVFIFLAKIIEVSLGTVRIILINKGYRWQSSLLALIEIFMWVFIASQVINNISTEPIRGIVYGIAFATGVYVGSIIENKLAFGIIRVETITSQAKGIEIATFLRKNNHGVTTINAQGKDDAKVIIQVFAPRRGSDLVVKEILSIDPSAMVTREDISKVTGGYVSRAKSLFK